MIKLIVLAIALVIAGSVGYMIGLAMPHAGGVVLSLLFGSFMGVLALLVAELIEKSL